MRVVAELCNSRCENTGVSRDMLKKQRAQSRRAKVPYLTEDMWSRISEHMTPKDWCKAAGTCRASYNAPMKWARMTRYLPSEGVS